MAFDAPTEGPLPPLVAVLDEALSLPGASFVIHRRQLLVEFATGTLRERIALYTHGSMRSWQIGPSDGHHCHLDLDAITAVRFDAEAVPCQRGRTNWTAWFLCEGDTGDPYRPRALCSVALTRPWRDDGTVDHDVLDPMLALYDRARSVRGVEASEAFQVSQRESPGPTSTSTRSSHG